MKNIIVSLDFDQSTDILLEKTFEIANTFKSKVWLLHITSPTPDFNDYRIGPIYLESVRDKLVLKEQKLLARYTDLLVDRGIEAEGVLIQGATDEMILEESKKLNIDLLIIGRHPQGFIDNLFINSTSKVVINKSQIPVLIVPLD